MEALQLRHPSRQARDASHREPFSPSGLIPDRRSQVHCQKSKQHIVALGPQQELEEDVR